MQGLFFESDSGVRVVIRAIVVLIGFWTAWRSGKAAADGWSNYPLVIVYTFLLAWVMQFLHHALFDGPMLDAVNYAIDFVTLLQTEQTLFTTLDSLSQARLAHFQAAVTLYQALGGGIPWLGRTKI